MRCISLLLLSAGFSLHALKAGQRYDFVCSDGQDILNAELVSEDSQKYYVRLSASVHNISIEKRYVTSTLEIVSNKGTKKAQVDFLGGAGVAFSTGRLIEFAAYSPAVFLRLTLPMSEKLRIVTHSEGQYFWRETSSLVFLLATTGIEFKSPVSWKEVDFFGGGGIGVAHITAKTVGFSQIAVEPAATVWISGQYAINPKWKFVSILQFSYVHDQRTLLLTPSLVLGVSYSFSR